MKVIFGLLILALSAMAIQISCKKTTSTNSSQQHMQSPVTLDSMRLCNDHTNWDSASLRNALIATWQWEYIKCYWYPERANSEDFKNLSIEFKNNDSLEIKLKGQITQKSSWRLMRIGDGYFKLLVEPFVPQLPGKILFCHDRLLFYDSYVDGCDNYFKK